MGTDSPISKMGDELGKLPIKEAHSGLHAAVRLGMNLKCMCSSVVTASVGKNSMGLDSNQI